MANVLVAIKTDIGKMHGEFAKALPGHIPADKFVRTAQTAVALTRNIEKVTDIKALIAEISKAAADGLIIDGREAALVIDYQGRPQYRPMMRGLLKLAYNSGEVKSIVVEKVCANDEFTYSPTADDPIVHTINLKEDRGDAYAYYALAKLRDGGIVHEVMTKADVLRIRDRSDGWKAFKAGKIKSTPWHTDEVEMSRKTVFRRLSKYLPSSTDRDNFRQAVERLDDDYTFEADADANGDIGTPKPATKKRGGAASVLKNVTPVQKPQQKREAKPADDDVPDFDPDTGEIIDGEIIDNDMQPGDDI